MMNIKNSFLLILLFVLPIEVIQAQLFVQEEHIVENTVDFELYEYTIDEDNEILIFGIRPNDKLVILNTDYDGNILRERIIDNFSMDAKQIRSLYADKSVMITDGKELLLIDSVGVIYETKDLTDVLLPNIILENKWRVATVTNGNIFFHTVDFRQETEDFYFGKDTLIEKVVLINPIDLTDTITYEEVKLTFPGDYESYRHEWSPILPMNLGNSFAAYSTIIDYNWPPVYYFAKRFNHLGQLEETLEGSYNFADEYLKSYWINDKQYVTREYHATSSYNQEYSFKTQSGEICNIHNGGDVATWRVSFILFNNDYALAGVNISNCMGYNQTIEDISYDHKLKDLDQAFSINKEIDGLTIYQLYEKLQCFSTETDLVITSPDDIAAFEALYPDCSILLGNLIFQGELVTDLSFLERFERIYGNLIIENTSITDFEITTQLTIDKALIFRNNPNWIGGSILDSISVKEVKLLNNDSLVSIDFLENTTIIDSIIIQQNLNLSICNIPTICLRLFEFPELVIIEDNALGCIDRLAVEAECFTNSFSCPLGIIPDDLVINNNYILQTIQNCTVINGDLTVTEMNGSTNEIIDLSLIEEIKGSLIIKNTSIKGIILNSNLKVEKDIILEALPNFDSLEGGESITKISGKLKIIQTKLTNLTGLENLTSIDTLEIRNNDSLINLSGLENLASVNSIIP